MAISDLSLMSSLKTSMQWHQQRQKVLAENVANADTPGYRGKDLKALPFTPAGGVSRPQAPRLEAALTSSLHMALRPSGSEFGENAKGAFEVTPNGNSVSLEDEMIKSGENQIDYQAVTTLYQRSLGMLRTAIGRKG